MRHSVGRAWTGSSRWTGSHRWAYFHLLTLSGLAMIVNFDFLISKSNQLMFIPKCSGILSLVKFPHVHNHHVTNFLDACAQCTDNIKTMPPAPNSGRGQGRTGPPANQISRWAAGSGSLSGPRLYTRMYFIDNQLTMTSK